MDSRKWRDKPVPEIKNKIGRRFLTVIFIPIIVLGALCIHSVNAIIDIFECVGESWIGVKDEK